MKNITPPFWAAKARSLIKKSFESQDKFAEAIGKDQGWISHKLSGRRKSSTEDIEVIAKGLNIHPSALFESSVSDIAEGKTLVFDDNVTEGPTIKGYIPLISWVQAGCWEEAIDLYHLNDGEKILPTTTSHSKKTFALRVEGNSMTAPPGHGKSFPEGMAIFVDPEQRGAVTNGSFVVARLKGSQNVTFKQLGSEEGEPVLKPLNPSPSYSVIRDRFEIIGRVIDASWGGF